MALPTWFGQRYATPIRSNRHNYYRRNRQPRTPQQLRALKSRTRCLKCADVGHWRAECPKRYLTMSDAVNVRLNSNGTTPQNFHSTLVALVHDEDQHAEYLLDLTQEHDNTDAIQAANGWLETELDPFDTALAALQIHDPEQDGSDTTTSNVNFVMQTDLVHNINHTIASSSATNAPFAGALIDTGAPKSVIGTNQARAYFKFAGTEPRFVKSSARFRFEKPSLSPPRKFSLI